MAVAVTVNLVKNTDWVTPFSSRWMPAEVAPVKLLPVRVAGFGGAARENDAGFTEAIVGSAPGATTVKVTGPVVPPAVVAVMDCAPRVALAAITKVAVIWVAVTVGAAAVVMPVGRVSVAPVRFVPVMVTATLDPCTPELGAIEASVGVAAVTVNVKALLVPPA